MVTCQINKHLGAIIVLIVFSGCTRLNEAKKEQNFEFKTQLSLQIAYPNNVSINKEMCFKLYFKDTNLIIVSAYIDCHYDSIRMISVDKSEIIGCNMHLYVRNDTVQICSKPMSIGKLKYDDIKILYYDKDSNYYIADTSIVIDIK